VTQTIIFIGVIALAVGWRIWRAVREQRMKVAWLWVGPALVGIIAVSALVVDGLTRPLDIGIAAVVLALGLATGLYQGTHTLVRVDRNAGLLYVKSKPFAAAIVTVVIAARIILRTSYVLPALQSGSAAVGNVPLPPKGGTLELTSGMLLVFALGLISGMRIYLYRKYKESDTPAAG
jgi:hypothetical protein